MRKITYQRMQGVTSGKEMTAIVANKRLYHILHWVTVKTPRESFSTAYLCLCILLEKFMMQKSRNQL
jgi:hypothetical protein